MESADGNINTRFKQRIVPGGGPCGVCSGNSHRQGAGGGLDREGSVVSSRTLTPTESMGGDTDAICACTHKDQLGACLANELRLKSTLARRDRSRKKTKQVPGGILHLDKEVKVHI